jgi:hypothetical protein
MLALNYRMSLASPTNAPPGKFAALRDPGFRNFVLLSAAALLADNVEHVITYYAAFRRFHSPTLGARTFSGVSVGLIGGLIGITFSLALSALVLIALLALLLRVCSRGHLG